MVPESMSHGKFLEFLSMMGTEVTVKLKDGRICEDVFLRVHVFNPETCRFCCVHNPSFHPLNTSPLVWRPHLHRMDRMCIHGITHPDPDDLSHKQRHEGWSFLDIWQEVHLEHECDGCCLYAGHRCAVCEGEEQNMNREEE